MTPFFLDKFLEFLRIEKRYSEHTTLAYAFDLRQFIDFLDFSEFLEENYIISKIDDKRVY